MARIKVIRLPVAPFTPHQSVRFINATGSNGRATFRPDWDKEKPWVIYWMGTAGRHFATLPEAAKYFADIRLAFPYA